MSSNATDASRSSIKPIDKTSVHRITSGQVVIDLQTAVKELVENSLDAGATNLEVKFKQYGLTSIEVIDNGSGIAEEDHDSIGLKHYTSKLATYADLTELQTFGFRGEALSSLCALCQTVQITTSTAPPMGTCLDLDSSGSIKQRKPVARKRGTTVSLKGLFTPLPVRRKELERNVKREFAKALNLLNAYALLPCALEPGVRLRVVNQLDSGARSQLITTHGEPSIRRSVTDLWGPKALDNIVDLELKLEVERERGNKRLLALNIPEDDAPLMVSVRGLISKFNVACGRTGTDRQFLYVNSRPCILNKVQKIFNEVYRSFNATQSPFLIADFIISPSAYDVNVSPDKRTIFLNSETNLITSLKAALEEHFDPQRSTFDISSTQTKATQSSLDQSLQQSKLMVTDNTSRTLQLQAASSPSTKTSINSIPTSSGGPGLLSSAGKPSSPAPTEKSTGRTAGRTTPLFIPDPDDDMETDPCVRARQTKDSTNVESSSARKFLPGSRRQSSDEEIVIDTSQASWNRPPSVNQKDHGDTITHDEESDVDEPTPSEGPPRKKHKTDTGARQPPSADTRIKNAEKVVEERPGRAREPNHGQSGQPPSKSSVISSKVRGGTMTMHKFLSGFASTQDQDVDPEDNTTNAGSKGEESSEDIETEQCKETYPSFDVTVDTTVNETTGQSKTVPPVPSLDSESSHDPDSLPIESAQGEMDLDDLDASSVLSSVRQSISSGSSSLRAEPISRPEIIRRADDFGVTLKFDLPKIKANCRKLTAFHARPPSQKFHDVPVELEDAGLGNIENEAKATEVLSRIIDKTDFTDMQVVGQFNLGFIIARRRKSAGSSGRDMDDLFIVDQHAADEKYNFETLQQTTAIQSQKLFRPRPLELTASDELVATENIDVLRKNGFEIDVDEVVQSGNRLQLTAQPVSKSTVFDMKDLEELIHLMRDRPNGQMVRCSKARAMFAMRACRKSVMIGMPMNRHQMLSVVRHMSTMDQPWNCPHGRPTMRHLADLGEETRRQRKVDWRGLIRTS